MNGLEQLRGDKGQKRIDYYVEGNNIVFIDGLDKIDDMCITTQYNFRIK